MTRTRTGAERAAADPSLICGGRVGLFTNFTGTMPDLTRNVDALQTAGVPLTALFGPEHGMHGTVQAGETEKSHRDARSGLPVFETYKAFGTDLDAVFVEARIDTLVFDMQDIGVRFYTYIWSLYDAMFSAARLGIRVVVLDRPNPLGAHVVAGPGIAEPHFRSFVGRTDLHQRHGLTAGELARLFVQGDLASAGLTVDLDVVELQDWNASADFAATGLSWVPPSPNMPTLDTAFAFCGMGVIEGTTLSEGRGTTRPFELIGAPFVDERLAARLSAYDLPGVLVREAWFRPTFHKHADQTCGGVQLHITDRAVFEPVRTALALLEAAVELYGDQVALLAPGTPIVPEDTGYGIDRLWGSAALREAITGIRPFSDLTHDTQPTTDAYSDSVLLYPRSTRILKKVSP